MKKNAEDIIYKTYWLSDTIEFVNELIEKKQIEQDEKSYNERMKYLSSIIYKIPLYNFNSLERPDWIVDKNFNDIFKFNNNIYATVIDNEHIQEIKTGKIFPIVKLEKKDDNWESSNVVYGKLTENDLQFAISNNRILQTEKANLKELYTYLSYDKEVIQNYINGEQEKVKSMVKK